MLGVTGGARRLRRAMHSRDFALFVVVVLSMNLASQMIAVAIGWQVYEIHHRAFDLGLIGLLEFGPVFVLALPGGALADRVSRRLVLGLSTVLLTAIAAVLILVSASGAHALWPFLVLAAATAVATALSFPATRALALRAVATQTAMVTGPALGGLLFAVAPEVAYGVALALFVVATAAVLAI